MIDKQTTEFPISPSFDWQGNRVPDKHMLTAETPVTLTRTSLVPADILPSFKANILPSFKGGTTLLEAFIKHIIENKIQTEGLDLGDLGLDLMPTLVNEVTGEEINDPNILAFIQCDFIQSGGDIESLVKAFKTGANIRQTFVLAYEYAKLPDTTKREALRICLGMAITAHEKELTPFQFLDKYEHDLSFLQLGDEAGKMLHAYHIVKMMGDNPNG